MELEDGTMREKERRMARKMLDEEMQPFRRAAKQQDSTIELLRAVRLAVGIPAEEVAEKLGVNRSVVFDVERSERRGVITLRSLGRLAEAMGCKAVYGIVPKGGMTLEGLAEERLWRKVLGARDRGPRD
jgi:hypothetical protein